MRGRFVLACVPIAYVQFFMNTEASGDLSLSVSIRSIATSVQPTSLRQLRGTGEPHSLSLIFGHSVAFTTLLFLPFHRLKERPKREKASFLWGQGRGFSCSPLP